MIKNIHTHRLSQLNLRHSLDSEKYHHSRLKLRYPFRTKEIPFDPEIVIKSENIDYNSYMKNQNIIHITNHIN